MKKKLWKIVLPTIAVFCVAGFLLLRKPITYPVALFYDEGDLAGAAISKQALQSVVLAIEFFNSRTSSYRFVPFKETDANVYESIEHAAATGSIAVIGGINAPFASLLADASRRHGMAFLSLASGPLLARSDDFIFRPRPRNGGRELGRAAKSVDISSYSVIVSGFASSNVQDFIRDFEAEAGVPPSRTMVFSGNLNKHIEDFERIAEGMDAILLVLPDWLAAVALRELHLRLPSLPVFASNWAVSHRTPLLAGALGEGAVTGSCTAKEWDDPKLEFIRFVEETYSPPIPPMILAIGYDTVAMLDEAIRRASSGDKRNIADALRGMESVNTVGGTIRIDKNGDMQHEEALFTLCSGRWVRVPSDDSAALRKIFSLPPVSEKPGH